LKKEDAAAIFCPICWSTISKEIVDGKTVFTCPNHGPMNFVLDEHPLAKRKNEGGC
jgi:hypothetical protein